MVIVSSVHAILIWSLFLSQASEDRDFRKSSDFPTSFFIPDDSIHLPTRSHKTRRIPKHYACQNIVTTATKPSAAVLQLSQRLVMALRLRSLESELLQH